jgi:Domain of unknown function (DUF4398)
MAPTALRMSRAKRLVTATRLRVLAACIAASLALGCGNAIYAFQSSSAEAKLEEARALGAAKFAAYEYTMAEQYLIKASSEAAEADYGDAIDFAETSEEHADKAIRLSRDAHRGAGR